MSNQLIKFSLTAIEARDLLSADSNGFSDPYFKIPHKQRGFVDIPGKKHKTAWIKKTLNPVWNHTFESVEFNPTVTTKLQIEVFDYDRFGKDDPIGTAFINLEWMLVGQQDVLDEWIPLTVTIKDKKAKTTQNVQKGSVHVKLQVKYRPPQYMNAQARPAQSQMIQPQGQIPPPMQSNIAQSSVVPQNNVPNMYPTFNQVSSSQPPSQPPSGQPPIQQPGQIPPGQQPIPQQFSQPPTQPPKAQQPIGQPPAGQPTIGGQPPSGQPPSGQPPFQPPMGSPVVQPPQTQPPMQQPPIQQPPMQQPQMGQPPTQPPIGQPPHGQMPPAGQPPIGQPPIGGQPPSGQPPYQPPIGQPQYQPPSGQPPYQPPMGQPPVQTSYGPQPISQPPVKAPMFQSTIQPQIKAPMFQSQPPYQPQQGQPPLMRGQTLPPQPMFQQMPGQPFGRQPTYQPPQQYSQPPQMIQPQIYGPHPGGIYQPQYSQPPLAHPMPPHGGISMLPPGIPIISHKRGDDLQPGSWIPVSEPEVHVGLGWDFTGKETFDLDASITGFDAQYKVVESIFFSNKKGLNNSVIHFGDNLTGEGEGDDEVIKVILNRIPPRVRFLAVTINSYTKNSLIKAKSAYIRLYTSSYNIGKYILKRTKDCIGLLLGVFERIPISNMWYFRVMADPISGNKVTLSYEDIKTLLGSYSMANADSPSRMNHPLPGEPLFEFNKWIPLQNRFTYVGLGWHIQRGQNYDLDASIITFDRMNNLMEIVYHENMQSYNRSIIHYGDNRTGIGEGDDEVLSIDFAKVDPNTFTIAVIINSFKGNSMNFVLNAFIRLYDTQKPIGVHILNNCPDCVGLCMGLLRKDDKGIWYFCAIKEIVSGIVCTQSVNDVRYLLDKYPLKI